MQHNLFYLLKIALLSFLSTAALAYELPVGVETPWIDVDIQRPSRPASWNSEVEGFYFIDQSKGSDSNGYGTPGNPRATIPNPIPSGAYIEVNGTYSHMSGGASHINAAGTADNPVWVIGVDGSNATFSELMLMYGSYLIVDGFKYESGGTIRFKNASNHVLVRNCEFTGNPSSFSISGSPEGHHRHIVFYNNTIHDNLVGWNEGTADIDQHGIAIGNYANNIWILKNTFYNIAGNGIQMTGNANTFGDINRVFVADNTVHDTRQSGFAVKYAKDVVFSTNHIYHMRNVGQQDLAAFTIQYHPSNVWFVNNIIHDCDNGIRSQSTDGHADEKARIVGNLIYDISYPGVATDNTWTNGTALRFNGMKDVAAVNNTIYNVDVGVTYDEPNSNFHLENNIIHTVNEGRFINFETNSSGEKAYVRNNVFYGSSTVKLGGHIFPTVSSLNAFSSQTTGNFDKDPLFDDEFVLAETTYKNAGLPTEGLHVDVYTEFENSFSASIRKDIQKILRASSPTVGAYEVAPGGVPSKARPSPPILSN